MLKSLLLLGSLTLTLSAQVTAIRAGRLINPETGNAAANLAIIKHIAYNLIRRGKETRKRQAFLPKQAKARRMGRRLPPKPPRRMIPSPDSPGFVSYVKRGCDSNRCRIGSV